MKQKEHHSIFHGFHQQQHTTQRRSPKDKMWRKEEKELGLQSLKDCSQQPTSSLFSTLHSKYESLDGVLEES